MTSGPPLHPVTRPTFHFIGVTTTQSSIMKVFPLWAAHMGLGEAVIRGIDLPPHADPESYREVVRFIARDPLSLGALVTTHKLDLFAACADMFDEIDSLARMMAETSCLSKRGGRLACHAKDPISSGLTIDGMLSPDHFARTGGHVLCLGAGGSTIAMTWHLMQARPVPPARIVVSEIDETRLAHIRAFHERLAGATPVAYQLARGTEDNDALLEGLPPGSLVVNATGLGKDVPGSPLGPEARFPEGAVVWELNYRGDLLFLDHARAQARDRRLRVHDGWDYFLHGWTQVIAEVFDVMLPTDGPGFEAIGRIAADATGRARKAAT